MEHLHKNPGGFSLLELLVTLSLSLIITGLSIPSLYAVIKKGKVRQEAEKIATLLQEGRTIASFEQMETAVSFQNNSASLFSVVNSEIRRKIHLRSDMTLRAPRKPISFYPDQVTQPGRVILEHHTYYCEVIISLRGRIRTRCQ